MPKLPHLLERNISSIFNERIGRRRRAALKNIWARDGILWSAEGIYVGHQAIDKAVARLLQTYPEYDFSPAGEIDEIPDAARMNWNFGVVGQAPAIRGLDVITIFEGRIVAMYRFLDGAGL